MSGPTADDGGWRSFVPVLGSIIVVAAIVFGFTRLGPSPSELSCARLGNDPFESDLADVAKEIDPSESVDRSALEREIETEIDFACDGAESDYRPVNADLKRRIIRQFRELQR